jgi:hypothetical protein
MSIAADEAEKEIYRSCLEGCAATAIFAFQNGYVAGRTAEPTEAEIEAGAEALCEYYEDDELTDDRRIAALLVLYAAYEAVSE